MIRKTIFLILLFNLLLVVFSLPVTAGQGHLFGEAEWRFGAFSAEEDGEKISDTSYATQHYAVYYDTSGQLSGGRLGKYSLALGYEWNWVDAETGLSEPIQVDNPLGKILYRGDLELAPGGLPVRLHLYSHDMKSTTFIESDVGVLFTEVGEDNVSRSITSLSNGSRVQSGVTFEAGIRNGSYEGRYRDVLSKLPRLLIDYSQLDVHDVRGPEASDYIDRNLAFISLNKKSNWFHYRAYTHDDRLDAKENTDDRMFLLGNINYQDRRQWVNLTNWIRISSDISFSTFDSKHGKSTRYDLNLFSRAQRTRWQASNYTSFSRTTDHNDLETNLIVPFYASGVMNRNTAWRFRLEGYRYQKFIPDGAAEEQTDSLLLSGQVTTLRQARFVITPELTLGLRNGTEGRGSAARARINLATNSAYRPAADLETSYSITAFDGTSEFGMPVSYFEQVLTLGVEKNLTSSLLGGFNGELLYGTGTYHLINDDIQPVSRVFLRFQPTMLDGDYVRSQSNFYIEHHTQSNLENRINLFYEKRYSPSNEDYHVMLSHRMTYSGRSLYVNLTNMFSQGSELVDLSLPSQADIDTDFTRTIESSGSLSYTPSRVVSVGIGYKYSLQDIANSADTKYLLISHDASYTGWQSRGLFRKLFLLSEKLEYEDTGSAGLGIVDGSLSGQRYCQLSLLGEYYPSKKTLLGVQLWYKRDTVEGTDIVAGYLQAAVNFSKLQVEMRYSYGTRTEGDRLAERDEQSWEIRIKKLFGG